MKAIGVANQKGGVGKTTTAREIAAMLAAGGHRTLAIDLDAQHDLTAFFMGTEEPQATIYDAFEGTPPEAAIVGTGRENLDLLPADDRNFLLAAQNTRDVRDLMGAIEALGYEYAVIDFPRVYSPVMFAALAACEVVVVPTEPTRASGEQAAATLEALRSLAKPPRALILVTRYNARTKIAREYAALIADLAKEYGAHVLEAKIALATAAAEAEAYGLTLDEHKPRIRPARDYHQFMEELAPYLEV